MKVTVTTTGSDEVIEYDLPDNELGFTNTILAENAHFKSLIDNYQSEIDAAVRAERARIADSASALAEARMALNHQKQLDADGCMVGVSRQAIDEICTFFDTLTAEE